VSFFETISTETKKRNLRFLVIGGLAVNSYGYSRETGDLDPRVVSIQKKIF